jgi:PAS domain S-box-containing protein
VSPAPDADPPGGRITTLPDGTIVEVNRAFLGWTGYGRTALLRGRRLQDLLPPAGRVFHDLRYMPALLLGGLVEELDFDLLKANGQRLAVMASAKLLRNAAGEPERILLSFTRAGGRRRYEAELLQARQRAETAEAKMRRALVAAEAANAAKSRFLAAMQHEFRTPIGLIMGYGELLAQGPASPQQQDHIAIIRDAADRLLRLVDDAALYTEVFATSGPLRLEPMQVGLLARQASQLAARRLADARVHVAMAAGPDLHACMQPKLMREGIASLMREVANRTPAGTTLDIGWGSGKGGLEVTLCCAALSLPPEDVERLRDPLAGAGLYGRSLEGAGLGVAIASQVMTLHRGELGLEAFEGGTRFRLTLPGRVVGPQLPLSCGEDAPAPAARAAARPGAAAGKKARKGQNGR